MKRSQRESGNENHGESIHDSGKHYRTDFSRRFSRISPEEINMDMPDDEHGMLNKSKFFERIQEEISDLSNQGIFPSKIQTNPIKYENQPNALVSSGNNTSCDFQARSNEFTQIINEILHNPVMANIVSQLFQRENATS